MRLNSQLKRRWAAVWGVSRTVGPSCGSAIAVRHCRRRPQFRRWPRGGGRGGAIARRRRGSLLPGALREKQSILCFPLRHVLLLRGFQRLRTVVLLLVPLLYRQRKTIPSEFTMLSLSSLENITCCHTTTLKNPQTVWLEPLPPTCMATYQSLSYALLRRRRLWHPLPRAVMTSPGTFRFSAFILLLFFILIPLNYFFNVFAPCFSIETATVNQHMWKLQKHLGQEPPPELDVFVRLSACTGLCQGSDGNYAVDTALNVSCFLSVHIINRHSCIIPACQSHKKLD